MQEVKTYRQYAADCRRMAEGMADKDKRVLLNMAEVWEGRAEEAERLNKADRDDRHEGVAK